MIINSSIINANPGEVGTPTIVQNTLPNTYRRVLGFTLNNNAYWKIDGVTLNGNDTVRISFSISASCNVFGCYSSASATNNFSLYATTTSGSKYLRYGNGTYLSYFSSSNLNRRFDVVMSGTGTSGMPTDASWTQLSFTGTESFCIGSTSTTATSSKLVGSIYDDVAVDGKFYGIPCERISDNKLGYYDVISETFFQPTGSGVVSLGYDAAITLSPVVTNTTGYITGGTIEGNPTTISASDLVSGTKNLTNTSVTDVTNYANAQIVDSNLTAANIANGVTVLGIVGTHQGGITPTGTIQVSSTDSSNPDDVTNYAGAYVAAGTAGTPTATKGTVNNHQVSVTPSVTNTTGYIMGGTKTGTAITVSASELVSGTKNLTNTSVTDVTNYANAQVVDANLTAANIANGVTVLGIVGTHQGGITPTGTIQVSSTDSSNPDDVTNYAGAYVAAGTAGTPTATKGAVNNHSISVTPSVTNTTGYITGSTKTGTPVSVSASELVSGTLNITNTSAANVTNYASAQVVDSNLTAGNIKKDVSILGVVGTYEGTGGAALVTETENAQGGITQEISVVDVLHVGSKTITQNGTYDPADDNYDAYSSVTVNVSGGGGTMQSKSITLGSAMPSTTTPDTGYNGLSSVSYSLDTSVVNAGNIKTGSSILGVSGTFTSDANATASDILSGKTAYVNGVKITGTGGGSGITQYITFTATVANTKVSIVQTGTSYGTWTFKYSTDNTNWNNYTVGTDITISAIGDYVSFAGIDNYATVQDTSNYKKFSVSAGGANVSGTLAGFYGQNGNYAGEYAYYYLFYNQTRIYDISNLIMPSGSIHSYALYSCFRGCTQLETPCTLPATVLATYAYAYMFFGCTKLTSCPALPATTLGTYCYAGMFRGCTTLTTTMSSLPAMTMKNYAYNYMFYGCTALETHCPLPATTLATSCYEYMFSGCSALETIASLPATRLANNCYKYMYFSAVKIKVSETQTGDYQNAWRIPTSGTGSTGSNWNVGMISSTGGTFTSDPSVNTTYYTSNTVVAPT